MPQSAMHHQGKPGDQPAVDRYRINAPEVVAEAIDDEVIVIHLKTGKYYSLVGAGADAWQLLGAGATVEETAAALRGRYEGDAGVIGSTVAELSDSLLEEQLMVPGGSEPAAPVSLPERPAGERPEFKPPQLEAYIDMQTMIQLDPIHETDERGWPNATRS